MKKISFDELMYIMGKMKHEEYITLYDSDKGVWWALYCINDERLGRVAPIWLVAFFGEDNGMLSIPTERACNGSSELKLRAILYARNLIDRFRYVIVDGDEYDKYSVR